MNDKNLLDAKKDDHVENKFLILGFWEFAILSTLMTVFFPWSLLFCVVCYGLQETKLIIIALFHDAVTTLLAVASVVVPILVLLVIVLMSFKK
jgi:hypothetical protein